MTALAQRDRYLDVLETRTWSPKAFGDWVWADELTAGRAFASRVCDAVDDPSGQVKIVRL